jgi:hypothetical protein
MGGGGGGQTQTSRTELDPEFKPDLRFLINEARRQYEGMAPPPQNLAVGQSEATSQALQMAQQRAIAGSPLLRAGQAEQLATIQGRGINPFLAGAAEALYRPTTMAGQEAIRGLQGEASSAGRYGSGAMSQAAERAGYRISQGLGDAYKQLAYNSSEAERARQVAASQLAPTLGAADYGDIEKLLRVGQGREQYQLQDIQGRLAAQDIQTQRLQRAANVIYGAPLETKSTSTSTPSGGK